MAWCPICKCEYKEGITRCADCKVDLVDSLEKQADEIAEEFYAAEKELEEVKAIVDEDVLKDQNLSFLDTGREIAAVKVIKKAGTYRNSAELSTENKYSAYILLTVGILGIIVLALICLDVIPIYTGVTSKIITSSVMGTLFIVFIAMGIVSLKSAKTLDKKASEESDITKKILEFSDGHITADKIDEELSDEEWADTPDELKYFKRINFIKEVIGKQFMNLDEDYVDFICDEIYEKLFDK